MVRRTKIVKISGRFGARYGSSLRKKWRKVMEKRYAKVECPYCGTKVVMKRIAVGLWQCPKCGTVFAGGAYQPVTEIGRSVLGKA
ncbi:MAG: 50S ribosomal protein L37ae [Thermoprotei archaeon]|nr:MAG: 50S ribosomal protein L37ae [Thermoprotei archaeon]